MIFIPDKASIRVGSSASPSSPIPSCPFLEAREERQFDCYGELNFLSFLYTYNPPPQEKMSPLPSNARQCSNPDTNCITFRSPGKAPIFVGRA